MNQRKKKIGKWVLIAVAAVVLYVVVSGREGLIALTASHAELRRAQSDITRLHAEIDSLSREIRMLQTDTTYIERIARERLGMARKDERVFKFIDKE